MAKLTGGLNYWMRTSATTVTLQRNTPTKTSSGSSVASWADVSSLKCVKIPKKKQELDSTLERDDWQGAFDFVFSADPAAVPGDRLYDGTDYFYIKGRTDFVNATISNDTPYVLETDRRRS
jgi:hypothetical protein